MRKHLHLPEELDHRLLAVRASLTLKRNPHPTPRTKSRLPGLPSLTAMFPQDAWRPGRPSRPGRLGRRTSVSDVNARHAQAHAAEDFVRDGLRPGRHFVGADDIAEQLRDVAHRHVVVTHVRHQVVHAYPPREAIAVTADQHLATLAGQPRIP